MCRWCTPRTRSPPSRTHPWPGDTAEPRLREIGEQQVVDEADRLVANTETEAAELVSMYGADPDRIDVVYPGADLDCYTTGSMPKARAELGLDPASRLSPSSAVSSRSRLLMCCWPRRLR